MNRPHEYHQPLGHEEERLMDRLVDGELGDAERRELLLRFEREPEGWRRRRLAFLEAQNWREAFAPLAASAAAPARCVKVPNNSRRRLSSWPPVARLTGLAAGLALAFALGWIFHGGPPETVPHAPANLATRESGTSVPVEPPAPVDPVVQRRKQQGYLTEIDKRSVVMELTDGRKLNVPVHELRLRYVGDRTY